MAMLALFVPWLFAKNPLYCPSASPLQRQRGLRPAPAQLSARAKGPLKRLQQCLPQQGGGAAVRGCRGSASGSCSKARGPATSTPCRRCTQRRRRVACPNLSCETECGEHCTCFALTLLRIISGSLNLLPVAYSDESLPAQTLLFSPQSSTILHLHTSQSPGRKANYWHRVSRRRSRRPATMSSAMGSWKAHSTAQFVGREETKGASARYAAIPLQAAAQADSDGGLRGQHLGILEAEHVLGLSVLLVHRLVLKAVRQAQLPCNALSWPGMPPNPSPHPSTMTLLAQCLAPCRAPRLHRSADCRGWDGRRGRR
jgi:hypothetical protein